MKAVKKITFKSPINIDNGYTVSNVKPEAESTMELYTSDGTLDDGCGEIEWIVEELDIVENIGVWWDEDKNLTDYDGVFEFPKQAIPMMEELGINMDYVKED